MAEAIGLAEMTETPLVVIDTQRGGPSTGLPTKHEQSDLMAAIYNTHGDTAKIVISPSSIEESFTTLLKPLIWLKNINVRSSCFLTCSCL